MARRKIYITEFDKSRLKELIAVAEQFGGHDRNDLESLAGELERADVVSSKDVPPDVVTMNSKVVLRDLTTSEQMTYVLVFPKDANIDVGAISVLAPVGTAILGYAKGDVVEWPVPSGVRRISIDDVLYQPEAAGDYHL
jgi:regulator of nucleoside diphosphate kinase